MGKESQCSLLVVCLTETKSRGRCKFWGLGRQPKIPILEELHQGFTTVERRKTHISFTVKSSKSLLRDFSDTVLDC